MAETRAPLFSNRTTGTANRYVDSSLHRFHLTFADLLRMYPSAARGGFLLNQSFLFAPNQEPAHVRFDQVPPF